MRFERLIMIAGVVALLVAAPVWVAAQDSEAETSRARSEWTTEDWQAWGEQWAEFGETWGRFGEEMGEAWAERGEEWGEHWAEFGARFGEEFAEEFGEKFGAEFGERFGAQFEGQFDEEWEAQWEHFGEEMAENMAAMDWGAISMSIDASMLALESIDWDDMHEQIEESLAEMERSLERLEDLDHDHDH